MEHKFKKYYEMSFNEKDIERGLFESYKSHFLGGWQTI